MDVAHRLEDADVERDRHRGHAGLRPALERRHRCRPVGLAARRQRREKTAKHVGQRLDHGLLARDDDAQGAAAAEERCAQPVEAVDDTDEVLLFQASKRAHLVEHADALEPVVHRALGCQLGVRAQDRELEGQAGDRALETRADLRDDLLQALGLGLEPREEVGQQLDERLRVAVERAAGDHE